MYRERLIRVGMKICVKQGSTLNLLLGAAHVPTANNKGLSEEKLLPKGIALRPTTTSSLVLVGHESQHLVESSCTVTSLLSSSNDLQVELLGI